MTRLCERTGGVFVTLVVLAFASFATAAADVTVYTPFQSVRQAGPDRYSFHINLGRVLAAKRAVEQGRKTAVRVPIGDRSVDIPTFSIKVDGTHITWVGRSMTSDHMQIYAVLSGCMQRDRSLSLNGNVVYGEENWRLFSSGRSFVLQRVPQQQLLPPPVSYPGNNGPVTVDDGHGHDNLLHEMQRQPPAPRTVSSRPASRARTTGRRLLELRSFSGPVQGPFRMLRMLVVFDQDTCTADERTLTSTMESMFRVVFGHNMGMNNFEMLYTCHKFTTRLLARNDFASAARTQLMDLRRRYGGDIMIVVGNYTYTNWWSASGDLGPSPTAVTTTNRDSASMLHVIPHEVGHNWGFDHDRFSSWSNQGTYYCNSDATRCNFGWLNSTYMTIMSYGTDQGRCNSPRPLRRVYVFSGYPIPGTNEVLGVPCGRSDSAWVRDQFEGNWNVIAGYYDSSSCPYFTCPSPPPPEGCVCSRRPTPEMAAPISEMPIFLGPTMQLVYAVTAATASGMTLVVGEPLVLNFRTPDGNFVYLTRQVTDQSAYFPTNAVSTSPPPPVRTVPR